MSDNNTAIPKEIMDKALAMVNEQGKKDYMTSHSFSATFDGIDGIPFVRHEAIAKLMIKYSDQENANLQSALTKANERIAELEKIQR